MQPPALREKGLEQAIRSVTAGCALPVTFDGLPSKRFDDAAEATAYFTLVEAITNAQKHSYATSLHVCAEEYGGQLRLEVVDNGVGGASESKGLGLQGLRDRIETFGGSFDVGDRPGGGTLLTAAIPARAVGR